MVPMRGVGLFQQFHQLRIAGLRLAEAAGLHVHAGKRPACAVRARRQRQQRLRGLFQCRPVGRAPCALHLAPVREHRHAVAVGRGQPAQAVIIALLGQPTHQRVSRCTIFLRVAAHEVPQQCLRFGLRATGMQRRSGHLCQRAVVRPLGVRLQQPLRFTLGIA
ncbi:hypothetical protein D3C72_1442360 [compost metagenome]